MVSYLAYGAIGLGLALAVLTYRLLKPVIRNRRMQIYVLSGYMIFAIVLTLVGILAEYVHGEVAQTVKLKADLSAEQAKLAVLQTKYTAVDQQLTYARTQLGTWIMLKGGKLERLQELLTSDSNSNPNSNAIYQRLSDFARDLQDIDACLQDAIFAVSPDTPKEVQAPSAKCGAKQGNAS